MVYKFCLTLFFTSWFFTDQYFPCSFHKYAFNVCMHVCMIRIVCKTLCCIQVKDFVQGNDWVRIQWQVCLILKWVLFPLNYASLSHSNQIKGYPTYSLLCITPRVCSWVGEIKQKYKIQKTGMTEKSYIIKT